MDAASAYHVVYGNSFVDSMLELSSFDRQRVEHLIDILEDLPYLGRIFDPYYESASFPLDIMFISVDRTHCVLYYLIDEDERQLSFVYLGDSRQDPMLLFDIAQDIH